MPDYLPHTDDEIAEMLGFLGLGSLAELFDAVPAALRIAGGLQLEEGVPEPDVLRRASERGAANQAAGLICFAGGGAYDHEVPPVVRALAGRSEFVTAYTPYQPEVAQGGLQAIFEFQTMMSRLFGLPIANASLYDGASAVVEAVNLGVGATGKEGVLVSAGVHPHWRSVLATFAAGTGHRIVEVPLSEGRTDWGAAAGAQDVGVVVVAYPNYLGCLEDLAKV
ncbi:MAG: glycine dehydrogenase, partial [Acidimicrobiales bacterium]